MRQLGKKLIQKTKMVSFRIPPIKHPIAKVVLTFSLDGFRDCDPLRLEVEVDLGPIEDERSHSRVVAETILPKVWGELQTLGEDIRRAAYAIDRLRPPDESSEG